MHHDLEIQLPTITVWQPWASLIALRAKRFEFRSWPAPERYQGTRIGIHAAARPFKAWELADALAAIRTSKAAFPAVDARLGEDLLERAIGDPDLLPRSAILCTAILGKPIRDSELEQALGETLMRDEAGHTNWAWPLTDVQPCFHPATGRQGFWSWTNPVATPASTTGSQPHQSLMQDQGVDTCTRL